MRPDPLISQSLPHPVAPPPPEPPQPPPLPPFWLEFFLLFSITLVIFSFSPNVDLLLIPRMPLSFYLLIRQFPHPSILIALNATEMILYAAGFIFLGFAAARILGLGAPILEALLRRDPLRPFLTRAVIPALLAGILLGLWPLVFQLRVFHHHTDHSQAIQQFYESPAGKTYASRAQHIDDLFTASALHLDPRLNERKTTIPILTNFQYIAAELANSVNRELYTRLLCVSGILLILLAFVPALGSNFSRFSAPSLSAHNASWLHLCLAFILAPLVPEIPSVISSALLNNYLTAGLSVPSFSDAWRMTFLRYLFHVPPYLLLGWLYYRRGLESSILASFTSTLFFRYLIIPNFHP